MWVYFICSLKVYCVWSFHFLAHWQHLHNYLCCYIGLFLNSQPPMWDWDAFPTFSCQPINYTDKLLSSCSGILWSRSKLIPSKSKQVCFSREIQQITASYSNMDDLPAGSNFHLFYDWTLGKFDIQPLENCTRCFMLLLLFYFSHESHTFYYMELPNNNCRIN